MADQQQSEKGIMVLYSLINYGLLLCPEAQTSSDQKPSSCRASFSLMSKDQLKKKRSRTVGGKEIMVSHADLFGHFSIAISQENGRCLGLQPVVYHYLNEEYQGLSEMVQGKLGEIRALVGIIAYLEARAGDQAKFKSTKQLWEQGYLSTDTMSALGKVDELNSSVVELLFDIITDFPRSNSWNLIDWLDHFSDHFQIADSKNSNGSLAYYMQNEWRLGLMQIEDREMYSLHDNSNAEVRELWGFLQEIDANYFSDGILRECALLTKFEDKHFFDYVSEVRCPSGVANDVEGIISQNYMGKFIRKRKLLGSTTVFENIDNG